MADDDWRVTITLPGGADAGQVLPAVRAAAGDAGRRLGHRVAVSADGPEIFLYAGTEDVARAAGQAAREALAPGQPAAAFALDRWHPIEQDWEDASVPLPQTDEQRQAEHERRVAEETQESLAAGAPEWEVVVEMPSRHEAAKLAGRLDAEGHPVVRRWRFLFVGARNEDEAGDLAQMIIQEAPASASVSTNAVLPVQAELAQAEITDAD